MTGAFPESLRHHEGGIDLVVAVGAYAIANVALDRQVEEPAVRVPEDLAGVLVVDVKEIELLADAAMVTPLRLGERVEVGLEVGGLLPRRPVDAGELGRFSSPRQ
jgi:hypothetical protein